MIKKLPILINHLKNRYNDPLYENSFFILLTGIISSAFGFVFWILAGKTYNPIYVGISTALLSSITIISVISLLGLDQSIIRFFPERNQSKVFGTSLIIVTLSTLACCTVFILGLTIWAPKLNLIKDNLFIFLIIAITNSLTLIASSAFMAIKKSKYYFLQNVISGSKIFLLFPFIIFGALGIFYSYSIATIFAFVFSIILLYKFNIHPTNVDKEFLSDSLHFSAGNYSLSILMIIPTQILPILILSLLGAAETAYFYISFTIASILFLIPGAFGTSLFVQGSHGEPMKKNTIKSILAIYTILLPSAAILYFFAGFFLGLIGKSYLNALELFRLLVISTLFSPFPQIYFSIKKVQKDIKKIILVAIPNFSFTIILSYLLLIKYGLIGVGYAFLITNVIMTFIVVLLAKIENWI